MLNKAIKCFQLLQLHSGAPVNLLTLLPSLPAIDTVATTSVTSLQPTRMLKSAVIFHSLYGSTAAIPKIRSTIEQLVS